MEEEEGRRRRGGGGGGGEGLNSQSVLSNNAFIRIFIESHPV